MSAITVTHDYIETLKHASEVMVLNKGRVVQRASSSSLYLNPKNLYVAGLLGEFNVCKQKERMWFFRPEEVMINPKGEHKATVVQKRFAGAYSEWTLNTEFGDILAYVNKDQVEGEQTRFNFPQHSEVIHNKILQCK
jgi:ABC-type Fe3+/spermidine/putrescine transport system ATPase subunit